MTKILESFCEISENYNVLICDLWGCLHNGKNSFPNALRTLKKFRAKGGIVILVTNAPRPIENVANQIKDLGITDLHYDTLLTSGELCFNFIDQIYEEPIKVFHIGSTQHHVLYKQMIDNGKIFFEYDKIDNADLIVCTEPFNPRDGNIAFYEDLLQAAADKNLPFLCANPDLVVDVGQRREMCAGSIAVLYEKLKGNVTYFGKPHESIYKAAYNFLHSKFDNPNSDLSILCVGDGLNTDIKGANSENLDSLLVIGGLLNREILIGKEENPIDFKKFKKLIVNNKKFSVNYAIKFFQ